MAYNVSSKIHQLAKWVNGIAKVPKRHRQDSYPEPPGSRFEFATDRPYVSDLATGQLDRRIGVRMQYVNRAKVQP